MKKEIIIAVCLSALCPVPAHSEVALPKEVTEQIAQFKSKGDPDTLEKAVWLTNDQEVSASNDMTKLRMLLLTAVFSAFDPNYETTPPPPIVLDNRLPVRDNPEIDPSEIRDPVVRADYIKRLDAEHRYANHRRIQRALRDLMSGIAARMEFLSEADPPGLKELESGPIYQGLPAVAKARIKAEVERRRNPPEQAPEPAPPQPKVIIIPNEP